MPFQYVRQLARARRRTREKGLRADLSINEWNETLFDWGWMCAFCDQPFETIDHYIPLASGGVTSKGNCIPSCLLCNNRKGALLPEEISFVSAARLARIQQYLEWQERGLRGFPPPIASFPSPSYACDHVPVKKQEKKEEQHMSTKDMQWTSKTYASGKKILLYSDKQQVVLQVRYQVATEEDVITPSFRVAVSMTPTETIALATSLLNVASAQLDQMQADQGQGVGNCVSEAEAPSPWQ